MSQTDQLREGLRAMLSSAISSMMPVSCRFLTRVPAPHIHMRISLDAFPPRTGLSCMRATFAPRRAADMAVSIPPMPPPTTQRSTSCPTSWSFPGAERPFAMPGANSVVPSAASLGDAAPANAARETPLRKFRLLNSIAILLV